MFKFLICSCNADETVMDMPTLTDAPKGLLRACMIFLRVVTHQHKDEIEPKSKVEGIV